MRKVIFICICGLSVACRSGTKKDCGYKRITSDEDSVKNRYVIYVGTCDTTETMLRLYWDNGMVQSINYYKNRMKTGVWSAYDENGRISYRGSYINGKKVDTHYVFSPEGRVLECEIYDTNGVIQKRQEADSLTNNR